MKAKKPRRPGPVGTDRSAQIGVMTTPAIKQVISNIANSKQQSLSTYIHHLLLKHATDATTGDDL